MIPTTTTTSLILTSFILLFIVYSRIEANPAATTTITASLPPGVPVALIFDKKTSPDIRKLANRTIGTINKGKIKYSFQIVTIDVSDDNELIQTVCSLISRGVLALFGPTHLSSIEILNSITNFYDIPYISWSPQAIFKPPEVFKSPIKSIKSQYSIMSSLPHHGGHRMARRAHNDYDSEYDDDSTDGGGDSYDMNDIVTKSNEYPESNLARSANHTFQMYMRPDLTPAIISIIEFFEWSRIYYIYNYQQAVVNLEKLFDYQNGGGSGSNSNNNSLESIFLLRRVVQINSCHDMLRAIEASNEKDALLHRRKIIMIVDLDSKESYTSFLNQIKDLGMTKSKYFYLLASLGVNELEVNDFRHGGADIVGFSIVDYYNVNTIKKVSELVQTGEPLNRIRPVPYDAALVVDSLNYFSDIVAATIGTNMNALFGMSDAVLKKNEIHVNKVRGVECSYSMKNTRKWPLGKLVMDKLKNYDNNKNNKNVIREGLTGQISFDATGRRSDYTIGVHKVGLNTPLKRIGYYTPDKGLRIVDDKVQPDRDEHKSPVKLNRPLIVTTILEDPYMMQKSNEPGKNYTGNERFEGYCVDLIKRIAEIVNFTYEIRPVRDGKFGVRDANGIWDGMVGELVRHEADLAVAALTISSQRERAIEFSMPFMNIGISIMIKKPEKEKPGVFSFMAPLDHMIWVCVVLAYIGVSVVLFLVSRFSPYEWHYDPKKDERGLVNDFTMLNTLWFNLAAVMQQGVDIAPRAASGRVAASAWWFFTLILISSYTANLAAFLTVERMVSPIESVEQLAGQKEIRYGAVEGGSTQEFFKNSKDDTYRRMWASMSEWGPSVFVKSTGEGVQKVRSSNGKYAFLLESSANEYLNERQNCNTIKVGDNLDSKGYGIATPIKSELRDPINLAVLQLKEEGVLDELKTKWWFDRSECGNAAGSKDSKQTPLNLINVAGIFYILIIGLFVAVFVAMCELIYKANLLAKQSNIEFKEAMKSKMRLSISGYDESIKEFREKKSISDGGSGGGGPSNQLSSPAPALPSPK